MAEITIREIDIRFAEVHRRLDEFTAAIKALAASAIREERFKSAMTKIEALQKLVGDLDERVDDAEAQLRTYRAIGAILVTLLVIVLGAYLKRVFGL